MAASVIENHTARPLEMARSVRPVVADEAARCEQLRTLSDTVVEALWSSGLMRFMNPVEAGGCEPTLLEMIDVWQELAWQDGSVGWVGIANFPSAAFAAAYLPEQGFQELFGGGRRATLGGQFAPAGQGTPEPGGYRVTGKWSFGSGTGHAQWVAGGFIPFDDGEMRMLDNEEDNFAL